MLTITLAPETQRILAAVAAMPEAHDVIMRGIALGMTEQNPITAGHIVQTKLGSRGPKTLGVISGRLWKSVMEWHTPPTAHPPLIQGDTVVSSIGTNVEYAAIHEFGFKGTVSVRAHARNWFRYENKFVSGKDAKRIGKSKKRSQGLTSGVAQVRAHTRKLDVPARAMIRTGIEEMLPSYAKTIDKHVRREWRSIGGGKI